MSWEQDSRVIWPPRFVASGGGGGGDLWDGSWIRPTGTPSFSTDNVGTITENAPGDFSVDVLDVGGPGYTDPRDGSMLVFPLLDMVTGLQLKWPAAVVVRIEAVTAPAGSSGVRMGAALLRADAPLTEANVVWGGLDYGAADPRSAAGHEAGATNAATTAATCNAVVVTIDLRNPRPASEASVAHTIRADMLAGVESPSSSAGYSALHTTGRNLTGKAWIGVFAVPTGAVDDAEPVRFRVGYQVLAPRGAL